MKPKNIVVSLASGIGDAIVIIPWLISLKAMHNVHITGIFKQSSALNLIKSLNILDECIMQDECSYMDKRVLFCDGYFSDFLVSKKIVFFSLISLKKLNALFSKKLGVPKKLRIFPHIKWIEMDPALHMSKQLFKLKDKYSGIHVNYSSFEEKIKFNVEPLFNALNDCKYGVVQLSAGGSSVSYKDWNINKWMILLSNLEMRFPEIKWALIGLKNSENIESHPKWSPDKFLNFLGKTNIEETSQIVKNAKFYLGLDSGPMHLAALFGVPTFSLWGPTDHLAYGYESLDLMRNRVIRLDLPCSPCESPLRSPNSPRYKNPEACPEKECLKNIDVLIVLPECVKFIMKVCK